MNSKIHNRVEGQSLVLIALLMIAMIAFLGLVIDGGMVMLNRRSSQNASDAAAFAGVRVLALRSDNTPATESSIWNSITSIASANDIVTTTDVIASFIDQNGNDICRISQNCNGVPTSPYPTGVRVTTTLHLQPYFISIVVGNASIPVRSAAAAQSGTAYSSSLLSPTAVQFPCQYNPQSVSQSCTFTYNQAVALFGGKQGPGGFQWLDFKQPDPTKPTQICSIDQYFRTQCTSGAVMADSHDDWYDSANPTRWNQPANPPSPSPWIYNYTGVTNNNLVSNALDCWVNPAGSAHYPCWQNYDPSTKYPGNTDWTVPVFDAQNTLTGSTLQYHTVLFGEFRFMGYWFANNQCNSDDLGGSYDCNQNPPPHLANCEATPGDYKTMQKCLVGSFIKFVQKTENKPGICNSNGLDICSFGLSQ